MLMTANRVPTTGRGSVVGCEGVASGGDVCGLGVTVCSQGTRNNSTCQNGREMFKHKHLEEHPQQFSEIASGTTRGRRDPGLSVEKLGVGTLELESTFHVHGFGWGIAQMPFPPARFITLGRGDILGPSEGGKSQRYNQIS